MEAALSAPAPQSELVRRAAARELPRFLVVGGVCFLLNTLVLYVGTEWLHLNYLVSLAVCFLLVNAVGFLLNGSFTFRVRIAGRADRWVRYYAMMTASLVASLGLFYIAVDLLHMNYLIANVVNTLILFGFNYLVGRRLVFVRLR